MASEPWLLFLPKEQLTTDEPQEKEFCERSSLMPNKSVLNTAARAIFKRAIADSATQLGIKDSEAAIAFFRRGDCDQCSILRNNLARRIGDYLSSVDPNLQAVYLFNPDSACDTYEDLDTVSTPWSALNLIVWTGTSKSLSTSTLKGLREELDEARSQALCPKATALCFALNMAVVNNTEVKARRGYAAMIHSIWTRPMQVWSRPKSVRASTRGRTERA
jgi:hypothetical protein